MSSLLSTIFNIVTTLLLLPFGTLLADLATKILPDTKETANEVEVLKNYYGTLISTDMNFDRDYYIFEVEKDTNIAFHFYHDYTNENDLAWVASILDEKGNEISKVESAKNEYQVTTGVIELKKGTYYILIENDLYSSEDTYWFRIVE